MNIKDVYEIFPNRIDCLIYLEAVIWKGVPVCPYCGSKKKSDLPNENRYHCHRCNSSYSVTAGTIFNKSKCDLQKWFYVICLVLSNTEMSLRQIADEISVTKDTVWLMTQKIQKSRSDDKEFLLDIVEFRNLVK